MKDDTRPQRYGWAPGKYIQCCPTCGETFFGDKLASLCADCAYALPDPTETPDIPELRGAFPLVLYFNNEKDRDEFVALFKLAKPNMETRSLEQVRAK